MDRFLLGLQGFNATADDYENLHISIVEDLQKLHKFIPNYQEGVPLLGGVYWDIGVWLTRIDSIKFKIDKNLRQVISLVKTGQLNDPKFYTQVANLYKAIKQYDGRWHYVNAPPQFRVFYHFYDTQYITQVVKPYNLSLIMESIYVIKDKTPIVDDNICDILSFLNDETHFTKHQVDTEIYAIM